jgi:hypothetical protein
MLGTGLYRTGVIDSEAELALSSIAMAVTERIRSTGSGRPVYFPFAKLNPCLWVAELTSCVFSFRKSCSAARDFSQSRFLAEICY